MIRAMRNGAMLGAAVGAGVAVILIMLDSFRPFPWQVNVVVERLTFMLCPFYILGFSNEIHSMTELVAITIVGNAILYGAALGAIAAVVSLFKRRIA